MIEEMKIKYNCENICEEYKHPGKETKGNKCSCIYVIIAIIAALFIGIIGILIGAALSGIILAALAAVIVLAIVLLVLLVLSIIVAICCNRKNKKHNNCCCCCR